MPQTPTKRSNTFVANIRARSKSGPILSRADLSRIAIRDNNNQNHETSQCAELDNKTHEKLPSTQEFDADYLDTPPQHPSGFAIVEEAEKVPVLKLDSPPKAKKRGPKNKSSAPDNSSQSCAVDKAEFSLVPFSKYGFDKHSDDTIFSTVGVTVTPAASPISSSPPENFRGFLRKLSTESCSSRDSYSSAYKSESNFTPAKDLSSFEQSISVKRKPGGRFETVFDVVLSPSPPLSSPRNSPRSSPLTPRSPLKATPKSPLMRHIPIKDNKGGSGSRNEWRSVDGGLNSPLRSPSFSRSPNSSPPSPAPGVVVTSHRSSRRRSSISTAAVAFAAATAGASVSPATSPTSASRFRFGFNFQFSENLDGHIVTMRVLKILKHWISKEIQVSGSTV